MMSCCVCGEFSGRRELCVECLYMVYPHQVVNEGAKRLAHTVMAVPDMPVRHTASLLER